MFAHREDAERGFLGEEASRDLGGFLNPRLVAVAFGEISDFGASPRWKRERFRMRCRRG